MADFILFVFNTEDNIKEPVKKESQVHRMLYKAGFYKSRFCTRLFLMSKKRKIIDEIEKVELIDDINVWITRLPFEAACIPGYNSNAVRQFLTSLSLEMGSKGCFMPAAHDAGGFESFKLGHGFREIIYKAHLSYILKDVFSKESGGPSMPETLIVGGESGEELIFIVRYLEPQFRYLTVVMQNDSETRGKLSELSAETGLVINADIGLKSALKSTELVINLAGAPALSGCRVKQGSLVINFNSGNNVRISGEYKAINGIEYSLPAEAFKRLGTEVLHNYSKKELSEGVMDLVLEGLDCNTLDMEKIKYIQDKFGKCGIRITGYTGRRGSISAESLFRPSGSKYMPAKG